MQILVDTATDSPDDMRAAILALGNALQNRTAPPPPEPGPSVFAANAAPALMAAASPPIPPPPSVATSTPGDASVAIPATVPVPPPAPTSASPSNLSPPQTDSAGTVWNPAQHSTPAKLNADGTWRARRVVNKGKAEAPAQVPLPPPPAPVAAAAVPPPPPPVSLPVGAPPAVEPAPVPAGDGAGPVDFRSIMQRITAAIAGGKFTNAEVSTICTANGVTSLLGLQADPAKLSAVSSYLRATYNA